VEFSTHRQLGEITTIPNRHINMSNNNNNDKNNNIPLTPVEQKIRKLEERLSTVETQLLSCLTFMRYHAEKEARRVAPLKAAPVKKIPQA
jgi:hypothetical protein